MSSELRAAFAAAVFLSSFFLSGFLTASAKEEVRLKVVVSEQKMHLYRGEKHLKTYPISTSRYGTGNKLGSEKTPLGLHRIKKKIGGHAKPNAIFENRHNTGRIALIDHSKNGTDKDLITSRILWLEGLEEGVNRGRHIDSFKRFIYIHGTDSEGLIGKPSSHGCIRMKNQDVIDLFERVPEKTPVLIKS